MPKKSVDTVIDDPTHPSDKAKLRYLSPEKVNQACDSVRERAHVSFRRALPGLASEMMDSTVCEGILCPS